MSWYRRFEPLLAATSVVHGPALVVAPHPDDEVVGAGGVILAHREAGATVHVAVMTDGGQGNPGGQGGDDYTALREEETRRALEILGGAELHLLRYPDGGLANTLEPVEKLVQLLHQTRPATVFLPSPYEVHPDHRATALLASRALRALDDPPNLYFYEIGAMMPINLLIDITPYMLRKEQALASYPSQLLHQDLVGKLRALNRCRTVNVDDPNIHYAEGLVRLEPHRLDEFLEAAERVLRITDDMQPPVPGQG